MTQTQTRPHERTAPAQSPQESRDRVTPLAAAAAVLVLVQGVGSSIHFEHTDEALYEMSVGRVLWPAGAVALLVLGVTAVVGTAHGRGRTSRAVGAVVLAALAIVEAYALLRLGPLAPSFD
ncbi:MAG TPA: hypothetical protein VGX28_02445 [Frankiaceae bacterium]|jgi:hypothetical protein|nr:hypothetical protein [Frankiaceae bacterium]